MFDYIKELEFPWVLEVLTERFDDALDLMVSDAMVYGGAIRDAVAGLPLVGDLDIVVPQTNYMTQTTAFKKSVKWKQDKKLQNDGSYNDFLPMNHICSFITVGGIKVQVIASSEIIGLVSPQTTDVGRRVDIVCCGLMMDRNGIVFEVLEGAHEDCKNKILRINNKYKKINANNTEKRIEKLVGRGWTSKITKDEINKFIKSNKTAKKKTSIMAGGRHRPKIMDTSMFARYSDAPINNWSSITKKYTNIDIEAQPTKEFDNEAIERVFVERTVKPSTEPVLNMQQAVKISTRVDEINKQSKKKQSYGEAFFQSSRKSSKYYSHHLSYSRLRGEIKIDPKKSLKEAIDELDQVIIKEDIQNDG